MIELHPQRLGETESMIRRVRPGDPSVLVGGIHLWVEGSEPIDVESLRKSELPAGRIRVEADAVSPVAQATAGAPAEIGVPTEVAEQTLVEVAAPKTEVAPAKDPEPPMQERPERSLVAAETNNASVEAAVAEQVIRPTDRVRRVSTVESTSHDQAESITMELTDRLLETNARKSQRQRVFRIAGIGGLVFAALLLVLAILVKGVLPIIRSIYGA